MPKQSEWTQEELIKAAEEYFLDRVNEEQLLEKYNGDLLSAKALIERLEHLKQQAELHAPYILTDLYENVFED